MARTNSHSSASVPSAPISSRRPSHWSSRICAPASGSSGVDHAGARSPGRRTGPARTRRGSARDRRCGRCPCPSPSDCSLTMWLGCRIDLKVPSVPGMTIWMTTISGSSIGARRTASARLSHRKTTPSDDQHQRRRPRPGGERAERQERAADQPDACAVALVEVDRQREQHHEQRAQRDRVLCGARARGRRCRATIASPMSWYCRNGMTWPRPLNRFSPLCHSKSAASATTVPPSTMQPQQSVELRAASARCSPRSRW